MDKSQKNARPIEAIRVDNSWLKSMIQQWQPLSESIWMSILIISLHSIDRSIVNTNSMFIFPLWNDRRRLIGVEIINQSNFSYFRMNEWSISFRLIIFILIASYYLCDSCVARSRLKWGGKRNDSFIVKWPIFRRKSTCDEIRTATILWLILNFKPAIWRCN